MEPWYFVQTYLDPDTGQTIVTLWGPYKDEQEAAEAYGVLILDYAANNPGYIPDENTVLDEEGELRYYFDTVQPQQIAGM